MKSVTNTIWGAYLNNCLRHGLKPEILPFTTLNEKLDIQAGVAINDREMPVVKYLAIGNKGHRTRASGDGIDLTVPIPHQPDHAALYNQIPFVLRAIDNDLTQAQRTKYALRKRVTFNGKDYYGYYLKRIDLSDVRPKYLHNKIVNGVRETEAYVPNADVLNPVPPPVQINQSISTAGEFLSSSVIIDSTITEEDVRELYNVAQIMYGDEQYAIISEMAFCSGVDRNITVNTIQGTFNFLEAIAVQVDVFYSHHAPLVYHNRGFDLRLEFGTGEGLVGARDINTITVIPRP